VVLRIAHRGASGCAPENTLEAFKKAVRLGVDAVEFDVRQTKDFKLVVMHDHNIERTTNGTGLIKNFSLKKLREFRGLDGRPIPILQEVLEILKNKCICKIHLKDKGMEEKLVGVIKRNRLENSSIVTSEIPSVLKKIKQLCPAIKLELGHNKSVGLNKIMKAAKRVKADIVSPHYKIVTKKFVEMAHKNGFEVHVWPVNNRQDIEKMKQMGVDGVISDFPERI
jgi:glycerophosphoryl diester phosphodiesterase